MNLKYLIEGDGVKLTRYGKTYRGRCPWHNGETETSLLVDNEAGKFHCFGCEKHGDSIDWLRERRGMSFIEACKYLDREPEIRANGPRLAFKWEPKERKAPADLWQEKAWLFMNKAKRALWTEAGEEVRDFLHDRGLNDETIKGACLGWNPSDFYLDRESWGLEASFKENGRQRRLWIPGGLVIPLIEEGKVKRLRLRRDRTGDRSRYVIISGSSSAPMTWNLDKGAVVIVESELDGILLNQKAGELAGVVAMGTATAKPDKGTHETLKEMEIILVSLDTDEAGAKASWNFWPLAYGKTAKRWPCIKGKDPSEARLKGLDLRDWIVTGLFGTLEKYERFCIQTVDGGLSDGEALQVI